MNLQQYFNLIKAKKGTIFSVVVLFLLIAMVLTFVQPFRFLSESRLLVVQSAQQGVDPYQVNKANEYVAEVLAKIVPTNSFFNAVMNAGFNIDKNYFPSEAKKQLKKWHSTVIAQPSTKGGIITITVLHTDRNQADQIIRAVNQVMQANHKDYHGNGESVNIRVIDQPFTSELPVEPNVVMNIVLAFAFGLIFALSYIYVFPEKSHDLRLWPKRRKKYEYDQEAIRQVNEALQKLKQRGIGVDNGHVPGALPIVDDYQEYMVEQKKDTNEDSGRYYNDGNRGMDQKVSGDDLDVEDIMRKGDMSNIIRRK